MIRSLYLLSGVALCGLLSACADTKPSSPSAPSAPVYSSGEIDGVYRGTSTRFQADTRACPSPGLVLLRVVDGQFEYRWNGRTKIESTIASDGTAQGSLGAITLSGKLRNGVIEGDVSSDTCAYHFKAVKRPH